MRLCFRPPMILASICAVFLTVGCGGEKEPGMTLVDAAAVYEANSEAFAFIRATYPGPFSEFGRVPARDPSKETSDEKAFVKQLRQSFSFEFIDFYPYADTGKDEIDVILKRYDLETNWTIISLVYSGIPLPQPEEGTGIALFDACDQRAIDWFSADHERGAISAFCRINEYWYAHQVVN